MTSKHFIAKYQQGLVLILWSVLCFSFTLSKGLISISFIGLCLLGLLRSFNPGSNKQDNMVYLCFILLYLSGAISFFYSSNQDEAIRKLILKLPILFFPLLCILFKDTNSLMRTRLATVLNYAMFLPSVVSVYSYLTNKMLFDQLILESKPLPIEFGYGIYHIQFSIILASAIVFGCFSIIEMARDKTRDTWFIFLCLLTVLNLIFIHILSARTGLVALYAGLFTLLAGNLRRGGLKFRLLALAVFILLPVVLFFSSTSLQNRIRNSIADMKVVVSGANANDYSFAMRVAAWGNAVDVIGEHPFLGVGIGDADEVLYQNFATFNPSIAPYNRRNPHNQVLENAVQSGLVSSLLFCLALLLIALRRKSRPRNHMALAFVLLLFISSCFESILESQASTVAFAVFLALAYRSSRPESSEQDMSISRQAFS